MSDPELGAQLQQGLQLKKKGKQRQARKVFQSLAGSDDVSVSAQANYELAVLMRSPGLIHSDGDVEGAAAAFEAAVAKGDPDWSPHAAFALGDLLRYHGKGIGDSDGKAIAAYRFAIDSGHPEWFPKAALELAKLLNNKRDTDSAVELWRRVVETDDDDDNIREAALQLGKIYELQGDLNGARDMYTRSFSAGSSEAGKALEKLPGGKDDSTTVMASEELNAKLVADAEQTFPAAMSPQERAAWLLDGERLIVDTMIVTANSDKKTVLITITDRRIRTAGLTFEYGHLLPVKSVIQHHSTSQTGNVKTTWYATETFTFQDDNGRQSVLQLSERFARNMDLVLLLREVIPRFINPARVNSVVDSLRNGHTWSILQTKSDGSKVPIVTLSREVCKFLIGGNPQLLKWTDSPSPKFVDSVIRVRDVTGASVDSDRFVFGDAEFLNALLRDCQFEFATGHGAAEGASAIGN